jgi:hypothetical protein
MKPQYSFDEAHNRVEVRYVGQITVDDVIGLIGDVIADPKFRLDMDSYSDFGKAELDWTLNEVDQLRKYVTKVRQSIGRARWAVVFPPGNDASTARVFVALHNAFSDSIVVKLFKSRTEAEAWLDSPKG